MTLLERYDVYFRRPDDAVVYATAADVHEVSLVHRYSDGRWHCALCNASRCAHIEVAVSAHRDRASA